MAQGLWFSVQKTLNAGRLVIISEKIFRTLVAQRYSDAEIANFQFIHHGTRVSRQTVWRARRRLGITRLPRREIWAGGQQWVLAPGHPDARRGGETSFKRRTCGRIPRARYLFERARNRNIPLSKKTILKFLDGNRKNLAITNMVRTRRPTHPNPVTVAVALINAGIKPDWRGLASAGADLRRLRRSVVANHDLVVKRLLSRQLLTERESGYLRTRVSQLWRLDSHLVLRAFQERPVLNATTLCAWFDSAGWPEPVLELQRQRYCQALLCKLKKLKWVYDKPDGYRLTPAGRNVPVVDNAPWAIVKLGSRLIAAKRPLVRLVRQ